jgi:hypothetical protein
MLRFFHLTAALPTILISLLPEVVFSRSLSVDSKYSELPITNIQTLVCYMRTEDGKIIDLSSLCKKTPRDLDSNSGRGDGLGQCYFLDGTERPCISTANQRQNN